MQALPRSSPLLVALCVLSALMSGPAAADAYPTKPINVIVPFPAGGATDAAARLVTTHLGQALGQTMPVENVGGASGAIAAQRAARANPDG